MNPPVDMAEPPLADDLLTGAAAIAVYVFGSEAERRRVYWLADTGQLPVFRIGSILCARKSRILRAVEQHERAAVAECVAEQPAEKSDAPHGRGRVRT